MGTQSVFALLLFFIVNSHPLNYIKYRFIRIRVLEMELCDGTLQDLVLEKSFKLPYETEKTVLHQIAVGLAYLHEKKIIHRDLKPRNILYSNSAEGVSPVMKLADFGCSRTLPEGESRYALSKTKDASNRTRFRVFGTDGWLAPEVLNGDEHYTYKSDIFPLGLIFSFTLCKGLHPFGEDVRAGNERIKNGKQMLPEICQKLKERGDGCYDLIIKMLQMNPEDRPSAVEVLQHEFFIGSKKIAPPMIIRNWNAAVRYNFVSFN